MRNIYVQRIKGFFDEEDEKEEKEKIEGGEEGESNKGESKKGVKEGARKEGAKGKGKSKISGSHPYLYINYMFICIDCNLN